MERLAGYRQAWAFPSNSISFKQKKIFELSFCSWLSADGKETRQLLQGGILHYGLRLNGNERSKEIAGADVILEVV